MAKETKENINPQKMTSKDVTSYVKDYLEYHALPHSGLSSGTLFLGSYDHFLKITPRADGSYLLTLGSQVLQPLIEHKPTKRDPDNMEETKHGAFEWQQAIARYERVEWSSGRIEWGDKEEIDERTGDIKTDSVGKKVTKPGYINRSLSGGIKTGPNANKSVIDMLSFSPQPSSAKSHRQGHHETFRSTHSSWH